MIADSRAFAHERLEWRGKLDVANLKDMGFKADYDAADFHVMSSSPRIAGSALMNQRVCSMAVPEYTKV